MNSIDRNSIAEIQFCLTWQSPRSRHRDCYFASNVNFWRDCFTAEQFEKFKGAGPGEVITLVNGTESPLFSYRPELVHRIMPEQFKGRTPEGRVVEPCFGRFYPQGFLRGIPGIFRQNNILCRCTALSNDMIEMDLNHPLAGRKVQVTAEIVSVSGSEVEQGGRCEDWLETISQNGPGAQAGLSAYPADFNSPEAWQREDERRDSLFYERPRFVHHVDGAARKIITKLHSELLPPGAEILDFMASWDSHLPENAGVNMLVVLGLNREELAANRCADEAIIQDINELPRLPFSKNSFDAVICTVSVEYMTRPDEVFAEIARVLRPGGVVIITFSNR